VSKKALIITDGTAKIENIAHCISSALSGYDVKTCSSAKFEGTDILPVDVFFIGCEKPSPSSFSYLQEMLSHINLASRKCAIFSVNEDALDYLRAIVKDCEATLGSALHAKSENYEKSALVDWVKKVL